MVQTVTGFKGWVDQSGEARRFGMLAPPVVENAAALKPTSTGTRTIRLAAGRGLCCGIDYRETATQDAVLAANTTGNQYRWDMVVLRLTWTASGGTVALAVKQGAYSPTTSPGSPAPTREPGNVYEWALALVFVRPGVTTIAASDVKDLRVWGGVGGPYQSQSDPALSARIDLPLGAELVIGQARYQATSFNASGSVVWTLVEPYTAAWKPYVPNIRNANGTNVTGTIYRDGRYRLENGACHLKVRVGIVGTPANWTAAPYTLDLPVAITKRLTDQWLDVTVQYPGWPPVAGKLLLRGGESRGMFYVMANPDNTRLVRMGGQPEVVWINGHYLV